MSDLKRRKISHEGRPKKKPKQEEPQVPPPVESQSESESASEDESATVDVASNDEQPQAEEEKKTFAELVRLLFAT